MKKLVSLLLTVCMCLSIGVILTACDEEHTHTYNTDWTFDDTHHWHACEGANCVDVADKAEHTWNDGEVTTEPTAEADGVKTFTCTACGKTKTEAVKYATKTTVTAEEWNTSMGVFSADNNIHVTMDNNGYKVTQTTTENLTKTVQKTGDVERTEYSANENGKTVIYEQTDSGWIKYPLFSYNAWNNGVCDGVFQNTWLDNYKKHASKEFAEDLLPVSLLKYELFTFTEQGVYYCETIEIKYGSGSSDFLRDIYISFENGELVEINYSFVDDVNGNPTYKLNISFKAEDLVVSLPEMNGLVVYPIDYSKTGATVKTIAHTFEWQNAIFSFQQNPQFHYTGDGLEMTVFENKIKIVETLSSQDKESPAEYSVTSYYANENGSVYYYEKNGSSWTKTPCMTEGAAMPWNECVKYCLRLCLMNSNDFIMHNIFDNYDSFQYDEATGEYYLQNLYSYSNICIGFENGKLVKLTFDYGDRPCSFTPLTVGDSFTLPAATTVK